MTIEQMLDRGYTLQGIIHEVRRIIFARVLQEEINLRGRNGAKARAARRLGVHRNTVTRQIWKRAPVKVSFECIPVEAMILERDPPFER